MTWRTPMKEVEIGKGRRLRDGNQVAVLSIGTVGPDVADAVAKAVGEGVDAAHYDMVFLKPIDENILQGRLPRKAVRLSLSRTAA